MALCLNYIQGQNIKDWADDRQNKMDDDVANRVAHNNEHHWTTFKAAYEMMYTDLGEKVTAEHNIEKLRMEKGDLDTYITMFNKLMTLTSYQQGEHGALTMFKKGLPLALNISIIQNTDPIPMTLEDWQKAA